MAKTIGDCLIAVGAPPSGLKGGISVREEWAQIKKAYFRKILQVHPDKGGSTAAFRETQAAFEVLRGLFEADAVTSFVASSNDFAEAFKGAKEDLKGAPVPSWEFYAEAAKEVKPTYRIELARSGRSRCQARGLRKKCEQDNPFIEKGALRVGFILESGGYGLWVHMSCWRVPSSIWMGLPDPSTCRDAKQFLAACERMNQLTLCGVEELKPAHRNKFVKYLMSKKHWTFGGVTEKVKKRGGRGGQQETSAGSGGDAAGASSASAGSSLVVAAPSFVVPVPGEGGVPPGTLAGQTLVVTGTFPEVGGGAGLQLGKDRVKKMLKSFGGKVTSAVSRKTTLLVVGKNPGFSKVSKARTEGVRLLMLQDVKAILEQGALTAAPEKPLAIRDFSKGFAQRRGGPNGLALRASQEELEAASTGVGVAKLKATPEGVVKKRPSAAIALPTKRARGKQ